MCTKAKNSQVIVSQRCRFEWDQSELDELRPDILYDPILVWLAARGCQGKRMKGWAGHRFVAQNSDQWHA
jgi:hypothetical protein